jgi:predicted transcriptional regulator
MENYVELDNIPETACRVLNVLWQQNCELTVSELTETVNEIFGTSWSKGDIRQFVTLLVMEEYVERRRRGLRSYYIALGADFEL